MKNYIHVLLNQRRLVALLTVVAIVFGLVAASQMSLELVPNVASTQIAVVSKYTDATPGQVDREVSQVIETAVRAVDGISQTSAVSSSGISLVILNLRLGTDAATTEQAVQKAVNIVESSLPDGVHPSVQTGSVSDLPAMQIAVHDTASSSVSELQRAEIVSTLKDLSGVRDASFVGAPTKSIRVTPRTADLEKYGVTAASVATAVGSSGKTSDAGSSSQGDESFGIEAGQQFSAAADVAQVPLVSASGKVISVGDVADVALADSEISKYARYNGNVVSLVTVEKLPDSSFVDISRQVRSALTSLSDKGIESEVIFDQAPYIESAIATTAREGILAVICAVLVILCFLFSLRTTFVSAISIPVSLMLTFIAIYVTGYSLNLVTLAALTVALGRLVDDAIVVVESISRELRHQPDRRKAVITGTGTVAAAVTASTLTTVAVFLPLGFVQGATGVLFRPFAFTVAVGVLASWAVSLVVVPVFSFWMLRRNDYSFPERLARRTNRTLERTVGQIVSRAIRRPAFTLALGAVIMIASVFLSIGMQTSFLAGIGQQTIVITMTNASTQTASSQEGTVVQIESVLRNLPHVDSVETTIGTTGNVLTDASLGGGGGVSSFILTVDTDASEFLPQVKDAIAPIPVTGNLTYTVSTMMSFASPIKISVMGESQDDVSRVAEDLTKQIGDLSSVSNATENGSTTRSYVAIQVDQAKAAKYGLSEADVVSWSNKILADQTVGRATEDGQQIKVILASTADSTSVESIGNISIPSTVGGAVRLGEIASVAKTTGPLTIRTKTGLPEAAITVSAASDDLGGLTSQIQGIIDHADFPANTSASLTGASTEQSEAFSQLGLSLLVAILAVYAIMVATFRSFIQPVVLLLSIPFALSGALVTQRLSGETMGVASLIGALMLIGIVVTNAIVLVDRINLERKTRSLRVAVIRGTAQRARPILMTAAATVFALLPLALSPSNDSSFIARPLAIVVLGGLASSTVLTLLILPIFYYVAMNVAVRPQFSAGRNSRQNFFRGKVVTVASLANFSLYPGASPWWVDAGATRTLLIPLHAARAGEPESAMAVQTNLSKIRGFVKSPVHVHNAATVLAEERYDPHAYIAAYLTIQELQGNLRIEDALEEIPLAQRGAIVTALTRSARRMARLPLGGKRSTKVTIFRSIRNPDHMWIMVGREFGERRGRSLR